MVIDYGKIIFGDVDSSDYGIYISGEGVYNAPERVVEFIEVPGRNGSIAMDQGRYENISITYPAMYLGKDQEEFREKLSDFRNAILSQKGYQRLEDSYHPDEYRMGVYASGLEVTKVFRKMRGGEFELTFNCKPQRWLTVGALPIPVDSGDVLQNPTVFDAGPLLEVEGYGTVSFNGFDIELDNSPLGVVTLVPRHFFGEAANPGGAGVGNVFQSYKFDRTLVNTGDLIYVGLSSFICEWRNNPQNFAYTNYSYQIESYSTMTPVVTIGDGFSVFDVEMATPLISFQALGPNDAEVEKIATVVVTATKEGGGVDTVYNTIRIKCGYDYIAYKVETGTTSDVTNVDISATVTGTQADSSVQILGNPTYIDCEVGEAYRIEDGEYRSANARVALGSDLPVLAPGSNTITFDNTVTDLKIAPRWWRI